MPHIFDNIDRQLLPSLKRVLQSSTHADFCIGYFNLRGWKSLSSSIQSWSGGEGSCCRVLVGMQRLPADEFRLGMRVNKRDDGIDNQTAYRLKQQLAEDFKQQLTIGLPSLQDEVGLRQLANQLRQGKVIVKLYLRHLLHAKLYLLHRADPITPTVAYLGSSNLTFAGLSGQGELNIDLIEPEICYQLTEWFEDKWEDQWSIDISKGLVEIIDHSWAGETLISPYHIYVKIAYRLSQEARQGITEFQLPREFEGKLFEFQTAAVKIAAHHLNKRNGVMIGDVVGLGKTLMATAVARIFEDDFGYETLIICPPNLIPMWKDYSYKYRLRSEVMSIAQVQHKLPSLPRYRVVLIDESHNLRNRGGVRYQAIHEYIQTNESKVILLSATPYNKTYLDLSNQLRLFVDESADLGVRPEELMRQLGGEIGFQRSHQVGPRTLAAFEKSEHADDWRELMRLFLVRRTRSFIMDNYAETDDETERKYLQFPDESRYYFPVRVPITCKFQVDGDDTTDQYAQLYSSRVVDMISELKLPRYGLGGYIGSDAAQPPSQQERKILDDLSQAGKRLMGFCRTNLFKRLESSGHAFILSLERHVLRNYIFLAAIQRNLDLPIGQQDSTMLDSRLEDGEEGLDIRLFETDDEQADTDPHSQAYFRRRSAELYCVYQNQYGNRFRWIRSDLFHSSLIDDLTHDIEQLIQILQTYGDWKAENDHKLGALQELLTQTHPTEKVLIFTQFADTASYLADQLKLRGTTELEGVTGGVDNPTQYAWRFSPVSNDQQEVADRLGHLRVLIATDVLSEGQNLQDSSIVVNYDLPWAIIRLVQRAGRVDRIGQQSPEIKCYSFLPAEGVEQIINLRGRVRNRLRQNAEVVGADEAFFEDDQDNQAVVDLYNEKSGILDDEPDTDVDISSYAYQIWSNAIKEEPELKRIIPEMPLVVYSTRTYPTNDFEPEGAIVYAKTSQDNHALTWLNRDGETVTQSQFTILRTAACEADTEAIQPLDNHHALVQKAVELIAASDTPSLGGQLGRPSGARFRVYERLNNYQGQVRDTLFNTPELNRAIEDIYNYPLTSLARDRLNRQLRSGITDEALVSLVSELRDQDRLSVVQELKETPEPQVICSLGIKSE